MDLADSFCMELAVRLSPLGGSFLLVSLVDFTLYFYFRASFCTKIAVLVLQHHTAFRMNENTLLSVHSQNFVTNSSIHKIGARLSFLHISILFAGLMVL